MSQSPIDDFNERTTVRYRQGWKALNRLLHEDRSFSGHERNCVFLNLQGDEGSERFADISAASGFDFPDDARSIALCDWDFDGDLDFWVTNRTAPRIRLLRNNSPGKNHYLAILLQGDGNVTNRDAVGARVEVILEGDQSRPLVKTLSAGDAFLSQSSAWLHFGLGESQRIREMRVHWPGGQTVTYEDISIDSHYVVDQQSGQVLPWSTPTARKPLLAAAQEPLPTSDVARTVLPAPQLLPTLRAAGRDTPLNDLITQPTIVSIWSSTCSSCVQELHEYAQQADRLRDAGLDVIAINLDNLDDSESDSQAAADILTSIKFPFKTAAGTIELVRSLDILKRAIFDRWQTLAVPTSFLVDERGFVSCIYQGPVAIEQLLDDLKLLHAPLDQRRASSSPFRGRWITPPASADP
ncbi:MAG: ASPIC/UnbV domain-containing protein, partial [Planctomycetales bacterium]|nr:ASPIC/UnbV domain-containing protein [Planctomycetales bacterium]